MNDYQAQIYQVIERRRKERELAKRTAEIQSKFSGGPFGLDNAVKAVTGQVVNAGGKALGGLGKVTKAIDETPIPLAYEVRELLKGRVKRALIKPDLEKKYNEEPLKLATPRDTATRNIRTYTDELATSARKTPFVGRQVSEATTLGGRGVEGVANLGLDPTNLLGIGIASKAKVGGELATNTTKLGKLGSVAAEVFGRGAQSKKAYLATQLAAGFGSGVGGEVGGTTGSLIGGFGGGLAGVLKIDSARRASESAAIKAARAEENTRNLVGYTDDVVDGIKQSDARYPRYKTASGERSVIDQDTLSKQIAARKASNFRPGMDEAVKQSRADNTDALEHVLQYMRETGSPNLLVDDLYDYGRTIRNAKQGDAAAVERFAQLSQAEQRAADVSKGAERFGDFRYVEDKKGRLADLIGKPTPEQQAELANARDLDAQMKMSAEAEGSYKETLKATQAERKAAQEQILQNLPQGARTAGRKYLSALITGEDVAGAFDNLTRRAKGADLTGLNEEAARFIDLHRSVGQAETELGDLLKTKTELGAATATARENARKLIEDTFGKSVKELRGNLIQIPGQGGRYRVKGFGTQDGKMGLDVEYVSPKKSIEESIGEGVQGVADQQQAVRDARERVQMLRREQAQLRKSGAETGDIGERIKAAEAEARSLELVRPVAGPRPEGTKFIPLDDATEFTVYRPAKAATARALSDAGIKDARTIRLMNQESAARAKLRTVESNMTALTAERERVAARLAENPADPELAARLQAIDESAAGLKGEADLQNAELERINTIVSGNQQALEATILAAHEEAANTRRLYEEALQQREANWQKVNELNAVSPEEAQARFLNQSRDIGEYWMAQIQKDASGKRLTQGAYDQLIEDYRKYTEDSIAALAKPAQQSYGDISSAVEDQLFLGSDKNAIRLLNAPKYAGYSRIDPDAWRNGAGGWFRKNVMGTGFTNAEVENLAAAHFNGESSAAQMADIAYGGLERNASKVNDNWLAKKAGVTEPELNPENFSQPLNPEAVARSRKAAEEGAWARSVQAIKDPLARNEAILKNAAKPITDHAWQSAFDSANIPEEARQQIYDLLSGNFLYASRNPGSFVYESLDPSFAKTVRQYGENMAGVEKLANSKGLMRNLLKQDYRDYTPMGRIQMPDGTIRELKPGERNELTDLYEIMQNAALDPKRQALGVTTGQPQPTPALADMMIPSREWGTTQAANLLNKVNTDSTWDKVGTWLKDPKAVDILKRGGSLQPNEWKNPEYVQDWGKLRDTLIPTKATGLGVKIEILANAMNKVAASTITGDASFAGVQGLIGMAMSPRTVGKLLTGYYRNAFTDEGWMTLMNDAQFRNKLIDRTNRGMGVGRASVTGMDSGGNLFQSVPGLKKVGNAMAAMDKIAFDRMQTINKMNLIDTLEADVQMMRAFGPRASQEFVDGIPTLSRLNQEVNLFQSTPEEISNAIIRQANNALGGLSKSQSLLGRNRQTLESTLLFVPGFFRARGGLINSVSKLLRNPDSPEGYLAASLLAREALFRTAFAASVAEITGTSDEFRKEMDSWAAVDPRKSGGSITGPLGNGGFLGLSWGNQAPKLYAQLLAGQKPGEFNLSPQDRLASIQGFFEGRTNPVIGAALEQYKGQDFLGRPVQTPRDRMVSALQMVTPMFLANTVGEANEAAHKGQFDPATLGAQTLAEYAGLNVRSPLPSEQLNSAFQNWQQENFPGEQPTSWRDAPSGLKNMAREDKGISSLEENYTTEIARRVSQSASQRDAIYSAWDERNGAFDSEIGKASQALTSGQMSPEDFKAAYSSLQEDRADLAADMRAVLAKAGVAEKDEVANLGGKGPQLALLMAEYNAIKPQRISGQQITENGVVPDNDIDWTRFKKEREAVLQKYSPEVRAQFADTQQSDDPNVQRLQGAREVLDTYFDTMPKYRGLSNVEGKTLDAYKSILNAAASQYSGMGIKVDRQRVFLQTLQQMERNGQISNPRQAQIAALALKAALDPKFSTSMRNLGAVQFLLQNKDAFEWYPWLESEIPSQLRPLLARQPVDQNAILNRELRGASLSEVR